MGDLLVKGGDMGKVVANIVLKGDLSALTPEAKAEYYRGLCESLGLNPLTMPFSYLQLQGKQVLYANKSATEQLRVIHGVSITDLEERTGGGVYRVIAKGRNHDGRTDASTGAVNIKGLEGEALANAYMKAETKAKRRLTLSLCGLGLLDESEVRDIPGAEPLNVTPTATPLPEPEEQPTGTVHKMFADPRAGTDSIRKQIGRIVMSRDNGFSKLEQEAARKFCDEHEADDAAMAAELARLTALSSGARAALDAEASKGFDAAK